VKFFPHAKKRENNLRENTTEKVFWFLVLGVSEPPLLRNEKRTKTSQKKREDAPTSLFCGYGMAQAAPSSKS
jgi:hypothetical protein